MATELLALAAGADSAGRILTATDRRGTEFLDVLIENEQKEVIAHTVVQRYLQASAILKRTVFAITQSADRFRNYLMPRRSDPYFCGLTWSYLRQPWSYPLPPSSFRNYVLLCWDKLRLVFMRRESAVAPLGDGRRNARCLELKH